MIGAANLSNSSQPRSRLFAAGSVTLNGITKRLMDHLQSVLNAAARLVHNSRKYDCISPLLRDLHWLRVPERIKCRMAVLVFRCRNQTAPNYLTRDLYSGQTRTTRGDDCDRRQLRSCSCVAHDYERSAVAPRVWNDLPADIVSAPSLAIFKRRLKTHLFGQSFG